MKTSEIETGIRFILFLNSLIDNLNKALENKDLSPFAQAICIYKRDKYVKARNKLQQQINETEH